MKCNLFGTALHTYKNSFILQVNIRSLVFIFSGKANDDNVPYHYRIKFPLSYCIELFRGLIQYLGGAMYMPVSAACQSCSFLGGQQQLLLHIPVLSFLSKSIYACSLIAF